jgi:hypothetical protein
MNARPLRVKRPLEFSARRRPVMSAREMSEERSWDDMIDSLPDGVGQQFHVVHRPVLTLILLARAQREESNWLRFNDIDELFWEAIRQLAPSREPSGLEFPFWYLQKNGFWTVEHPEILPRVKNSDRPTRRGLRKYNARGHVPAHLWDELIGTSGLIERLACRILDEFWPDKPRSAVATLLGLIVRKRGGVQSEPGGADNPPLSCRGRSWQLPNNG